MIYKMNINDIINSIYRLPQTSLDTLVASISEVEYPKNFHLHRENKKETKSYFIKKGIVRTYTPVSYTHLDVYKRQVTTYPIIDYIFVADIFQT